MLANAGVQRLGLSARASYVFEPEEMLPAIGQGIIGIECHTENKGVWNLITQLNHQATSTRLTAERSMNAGLEGGCQLPVAGHAIITAENEIWLRGVVAMPDASQMIFSEGRAPLTEAEALGRRVAQDLLAQGADKILASVKQCL